MSFLILSSLSFFTEEEEEEETPLGLGLPEPIEKLEISPKRTSKELNIDINMVKKSGGEKAMAVWEVGKFES